MQSWAVPMRTCSDQLMLVMDYNIPLALRLAALVISLAPPTRVGNVLDGILTEVGTHREIIRSILALSTFITIPSSTFTLRAGVS